VLLLYSASGEYRCGHLAGLHRPITRFGFCAKTTVVAKSLSFQFERLFLMLKIDSLIQITRQKEDERLTISDYLTPFFELLLFL
jgi:hypothetical protein